ncbi:unnamed protein product [Cylindrotheca closterium]|uniref:Uncharacterized protein n=1 Tax=Cylindrotheca closterium TaxID=2856 RepID=A0AAD2CPP7_9STRA|nr:unnamed protein product [Cylindrotheca closterium]
MSYAPVSTLEDGMAAQSSSSSSIRPLNFRSPMLLQGQQNDHNNNNNNLAESLNQSAANTTIFTSSFRHIPEASQLQWMDDFYQGKPGIVAVFDRNGHLAGNFQFWHFLRITALLVVLAIVYYFMGVWVAKTQQDEDLVILDDVQSFYFLLIAALFVAMAYRADLQQREQHVAITTEGIRIDQGMAMTVIIPFETIHSCEAHLTTKYLCGHMERSDLTQVQVVRSLAPMEQIGFRKTRSFLVYGLARPQEFVALVEAFKTSQQHGSYEGGTELTTSSYRQSPQEGLSSSEGQFHHHHHPHHQVPPQQQQQHQVPQFAQPSPPTLEQPQFQPQHPYAQQSQIVHDDSDIVTAI